MQVPIISGLIQRRVLVNYRVDPQVLARMLPTPFRPQNVNGLGVVGICLIRLSEVRPANLPRWLGATSENAAHRIAVQWQDDHGVREGVYIPRRDSNSIWNCLLGGRLFPGVHQRADFRVMETDRELCVSLQSRDGRIRVEVCGTQAEQLPASSVFQTLKQASDFFRNGKLGFSATRDPDRLEGLELRCHNWQVQPLMITKLHSSFFNDETIFPKGSIEFDSALLMRNIDHEWRGAADLRCCPAAV